MVQILHCGTFTVCHLAAMRYIAVRQGSEVIRLQAVYSAVAMGGSIALVTVSPVSCLWIFWAAHIMGNGAGGAAGNVALRPKVVPSC